MKKGILFIVLLGSSFIPSLFNPDRIIDEIFIVTIVGYDYVDENLFIGTAVAPNYKADKTIENIAFSDTSSLVYQNREKVEAKSPRPLLNGKLEAALFNRELAEKKGLFEYIDNLQRDPNVGTRVQLAIFEGSTKELLTKPFKDQPEGVYFSNLLDQNILFDNLPLTNMHIFEFSYFVEGKDPILPIVEEEKSKGKDNIKVKVKGVALFKKDKMVAEIPKKDFLFFKSMHENFNNGTMFMKLNNDERAFLTNIRSKRKFIIKNNQGTFNPTVSISIKMKGIVREYSGEKIDPTTVKTIEQEINAEIEEKTKKMIKNFQELGIDPIGIGHQVRNRVRNWEAKKWKDIYPTLDVNVTADVKILEHGVIK